MFGIKLTLDKIIKMLNEVTFQRRKECNYYKQPSEDSIKTIYDYILKQNITIKSLEKDIKLLKEQYDDLKNQIIPNMQLQIASKIPEVINIPTIQTQDDIKETVMSMITNDNQEIVNLIKNELNDYKKTSENTIALIDQKIVQIAQEQKQIPLLDNEAKKNELDLIDVIKKNNKCFDNSFKSMKDDYIIQISKINKRLNEIDNDFDRLIKSLKTQFQTVNETLIELEEKSSEFMHTKNTIDFNSSLLKDLYSSINQLKEESIRNETIITTFSKIKPQDRSSSSKLNSEMMTLRQDITKELNIINKHLSNKLENHDIQIKELNEVINTQKSPREPSINDPFINIMQELEKKADIEQLNYAMQAQSKINDALCSVSRIARWSWSNGKIDSKGMIMWSVQNVNTSLDLYVWNNECSSIKINLKGIYQITTGSIASNAISLFILINGLEATCTSQSHDTTLEASKNSLVTLNDYHALSEGSQLQIGLIYDDDDQEEQLPFLDFECYLELRKII